PVASAPRQLDVQRRPVPLPRDVLVGERPPHPGRDAGDEHARRNDVGHLHEGLRRDDRLLAHDGGVHDHRLDADERVAPDARTVDDGAVPDVALLFHHAIEVGCRVHHAVVLHVRVGLHHDAAEIAAQHRTRPDVAPRADDDVADQHRARVHPGLRVDHRDDALESVYGRSHDAGPGKAFDANTAVARDAAAHRRDARGPFLRSAGPPVGSPAPNRALVRRYSRMGLDFDPRTIFLVAACTAALGSVTFLALQPIHPRSAAVLRRHAMAMAVMSAALLLFALRDALLPSFTHVAPNILATLEIGRAH